MEVPKSYIAQVGL